MRRRRWRAYRRNNDLRIRPTETSTRRRECVERSSLHTCALAPERTLLPAWRRSRHQPQHRRPRRIHSGRYPGGCARRRARGCALWRSIDRAWSGACRGLLRTALSSRRHCHRSATPVRQGLDRRLLYKGLLCRQRLHERLLSGEKPVRLPVLHRHLRRTERLRGQRCERTSSPGERQPARRRAQRHAHPRSQRPRRHAGRHPRPRTHHRDAHRGEPAAPRQHRRHPAERAHRRRASERRHRHRRPGGTHRVRLRGEPLRIKRAWLAHLWR